MLKYESGEVIQQGDRVLYHGEPGEIEFVVNGRSGDPAMDWYVDEFGGGVMVIEPRFFGRVFVSEVDDLLVFVSRNYTTSR